MHVYIYIRRTEAITFDFNFSDAPTTKPGVMNEEMSRETSSCLDDLMAIANLDSPTKDRYKKLFASAYVFLLSGSLFFWE